MRSTLLILLTLLLIKGTSQNLVPDPGFENWNGTSGNYMAPLFDWDEGNGTPDHHHEQNPIGSNLTSADPNCVLTNSGFSGCGAVFAGQGCLGAYKANGPTGTKEWAATQLISPLEQDSCYQISFWIQNKKNSANYTMVTNQWGVYFDNTLNPTFDPNTHNFSANQNHWVTCSTVIQDTIWHHIVLDYIPDANYTHMYIGYVGDVANATEIAWSSSPSVGFYTWIDEVSVEKVACFTCPINIDSVSTTDETCTNSDGSIMTYATPSALTYILYDNSGNPLDTNTTGGFNGLPAGDYYVTAEDSICMETSNIVTISTSGVLPNAGLDDDVLLCDGYAIFNLLDSLGGTPNTGGTWNPSPISGTNNFDPANDIAGIYTYTHTTSCGTDSAQLNVSITTTPDATITPVGPFCVTDSSFNLNSAAGGGVWSGTGVNTNGEFSPSLAGPGNHLITYEIQGMCSDLDTITIVVFDTDDAGFDYVDSLYCINNVNPTPLINGLTGGSFSITAPGTIDPTTGTIDLQASGIGTYTVSYTTTGFCPNFSTVDIEIIGETVTTIDPAGPFCSSDATSFLSASVLGGTWSGPGIVDPVTGEFSPGSAQIGWNEIIYTIGGLCGGADTIEIEVFPSPTVDLGEDMDICVDCIIQLDAGTGYTDYEWQDLSTLSSFTANQPGIYMVTVTDDNGCTATDTIELFYQCTASLFVPNSFTPNFDGKNDEFITVTQNLSEFTLLIFDRWGHVVHETNDPNSGWNGSSNGTTLPTGVYVYVITYKECDSIESKSKTGHFTLLK